MKNLLYFIAAIVLIFWAIGFFAYAVGGLIHLLLVLALILIVVRLFKTV